jgi:hypothetical protein
MAPAVTKASLPIATPAQTGVPALIHTFRSIVTGAGTPPSEWTARIRTVAEICVTDPILTGAWSLTMQPGPKRQASSKWMLVPTLA